MLECIGDKYNQLTMNEKRLLHYISEHYEDVTKMTSHAVAQQCHVSKTVLITMAQKLGFEGFNDLKFYLKNQQKEIPAKSAVSFGDALCDNVKRTVQINTPQALETLAMEIKDSKCVYIIARGSSKALGSYLGHMLLTLNIKCIVNPDFNLLNLIANKMEKKEIMIAISLSGATKIIVETAQQVKARGNKLFAITSFTNSELAKLCDTAIYCVSDVVDTRRNDTVSRISLMAAIELILNKLQQML